MPIIHHTFRKDSAFKDGRMLYKNAEQPANQTGEDAEAEKPAKPLADQLLGWVGGHALTALKAAASYAFFGNHAVRRVLSEPLREPIPMPFVDTIKSTTSGGTDLGKGVYQLGKGIVGLADQVVSLPLDYLDFPVNVGKNLEARGQKMKSLPQEGWQNFLSSSRSGIKKILGF